MKEKGKMKSEKVWTSLLYTFALLLFTSAAQAEPVVYLDENTFKDGAWLLRSPERGRGDEGRVSVDVIK